MSGFGTQTTEIKFTLVVKVTKILERKKGIFLIAHGFKVFSLRWVGCLNHCYIVVKRHDDRGNSYKGKELIEACLRF